MKSKRNYHFIIAEIFFFAAAWFFVYHGILALTLPESFLQLFGIVEMDGLSAKLLLILIGILDLMVAVSLVFRRRTISLVYGTLWPLVPAILGTILVPHDAASNFVEHSIPILLVLLGIIFFIADKRDRKEHLMFQKLPSHMRNVFIMLFVGALIVAILAVWKNQSGSAGLLRICPDERIIDRMPVVLGAHMKNAPVTAHSSGAYYILDGERRELSEFDNGWIAQNCHVKEQIVW